MQYFSVWPSYTSHNWYKRHATITARWLLDEIYRGPRPQLCNSSSSLFEPKLFLAPPQCCSADTRRQSVENVKMYGILWLLPCHEPLVCHCLCLCVCVVELLENCSRLGMWWPGQRAALWGYHWLEISVVYAHCGSSPALLQVCLSPDNQHNRQHTTAAAICPARANKIFHISWNSPPNLLIDLNYLCK